MNAMIEGGMGLDPHRVVRRLHEVISEQQRVAVIVAQKPAESSRRIAIVAHSSHTAMQERL
eukprot:5281932-Prymnesium_polylepis.2